MKAHDSWLRKQKAKLATYLRLRSGVMSQTEAYYAAWPEEEPLSRWVARRVPRKSLDIGWA